MSVRGFIRTRLPRPVVSLARRIYYRPWVRTVLYGPQDLWNSVRGTRDPLVPPRRVAFVGDGDYREVGEQIFRLLVNVGGLAPENRVLDVGCGVGRVALPLAEYLVNPRPYEGFDIVADQVLWCQETLTPRFPGFRFHFADVWNSMYNPRAKTIASDWTFPFPDGDFDFVFLTSVFTHMLPTDVDHYTAEIARVLRPGGRAFLTFFAIDAGAEARMRDGTSRTVFLPHPSGCDVVDERTPETAVAYRDDQILALLARHGLGLVRPVLRGSWSGLPNAPSYQDVVLAAKIGQPSPA